MAGRSTRSSRRCSGWATTESYEVCRRSDFSVITDVRGLDEQTKESLLDHIESTFDRPEYRHGWSKLVIRARTDPGSLQTVLGVMFRSEQERDVILRYIGSLIKRVQGLGGDRNWSLSLLPNPGCIRLNVGSADAIAIFNLWLYVILTDKPPLEPDDRRFFSVGRRRYASIQKRTGAFPFSAVIRHTHFGRYADLLLDAQQELLAFQSDRRLLGNWQTAHAPALVDLIRRVSGLEFADPGWSVSAPKARG